MDMEFAQATGGEVSYDLQIWTSTPPDLPAALPDHQRWQLVGLSCTWSGRGWQIVAGPVHRVDPEDVPAEVHAAIPGVSHMVELNLEPSASPRAAFQLLTRTAAALASAAHGAIVDPQTATVTTPKGVRRYVAPPTSETLDALTLSWFSYDAAVRSRGSIEQVIASMERWVPEALPVRYGPFEPPPFRYAETGREHLIDFLVGEQLGAGVGAGVWCPRRPVLEVSTFLKGGPSLMGWRSHYVAMRIERSVLAQPGWKTALEGLWRQIAHVVHAFYADVRTLRHYRHGPATAGEIVAGDRHPVCGPFWAGIPKAGGHAVALGEPYLSLWPEFRATAERARDIAFLSEEDWSPFKDVFSRVGAVPQGMVQQSPAYDGVGPNQNRVYPAVWPFGPTHLDRR
jgi:hypothetical protein